MSSFSYSSILHYQNQVIVCNCIETMGDCDHRCIGKFLPNRQLNECISLHVYIGSGLVEYENPVFSKKSSRKTKQLFLANRKGF